MRIRQMLTASKLVQAESNPLNAALRIRSLVRHRSLIVMLTDLDDATVAGQLASAARLLLPKHLPLIAGARKPRSRSSATCARALMARSIRGAGGSGILRTTRAQCAGTAGAGRAGLARGRISWSALCSMRNAVPAARRCEGRRRALQALPGSEAEDARSVDVETPYTLTRYTSDRPAPLPPNKRPVSAAIITTPIAEATITRLIIGKSGSGDR